MKKITCYFLYLLLSAGFAGGAAAQSPSLKLVFIRHGERPDDGDNLNCQGLNRSMQLPALLYKKFGKPANIYIPALNQGKSTKRARMLETISPFAAKYNININSKYDEEDYSGISTALLAETGTVFIVWEHNTILPIIKMLGVKKTKSLEWGATDFDSIWIVTFPAGKAVLSLDKEGLQPAAGCPF
jgi:hypothetical protein